MGLFSRWGNENSKKDAWEQGEILAPVKGTLIPMSQVADPVFSEEVIGRGAALIPGRGRLVAPADGVVNLVFRTKHAIGMVTDGGTELLIHIGLDTVRLNGRFFREHVSQGSHVRAGDLLMEFELAQMIKEGYDMTTVVIVCNSAQYPDMSCKSAGEAAELEPVIRLNAI